MLKRDGCESVGHTGNLLEIGLHRALTDAAEQLGCGCGPGVLSTCGTVICGLAAELVWLGCSGERPLREEKGGDIAPTPAGPPVVLIMAIVAGEVTSVSDDLRGPWTQDIICLRVLTDVIVSVYIPIHLCKPHDVGAIG